MENKLKFRNWWLLSIQGLIMLCLGISLLFGFKDDLAKTSRLAGIFIILSGITVTLFAFSNVKNFPFWFYLFEGMCELAIGFVLIHIRKFILPAQFAVITVTWIFILGVLFFISLIEKKKLNLYSAIRIFYGIISVISGILILINQPVQFTRTELLVGIYAFLVSFSYLINSLSFSVKRLIIEN